MADIGVVILTKNEDGSLHVDEAPSVVGFDTSLIGRLAAGAEPCIWISENSVHIGATNGAFVYKFRVPSEFNPTMLVGDLIKE